MNIHSHPGLTKGKRNPSRRDSIKFGDFITSLPPAPLVDQIPIFNYPMDGNDTVGDCVVADVDHALQIINGLLTGVQKNFTQEQIWEFYKTQNPNFDPHGTAQTNGPGSSADNGMDIQIFLEYMVSKKYILGFASIDWTNEVELRAAIYIGLALVAGVQLDHIQMSQFELGVWDNVPNSLLDGGHAIPYMGYQPTPDEYSCVTWAKIIQCTKQFVQVQTDECWFILTQAHLDHPNFRDNFDLTGFKKAVAEITNNKININMSPTLKIGSMGSIVETLQTDLNKVFGSQLVVDGNFGTKTKLAVMAFQSKYALVADGIVGIQTWAAILKLITPVPTVPVDALLNAIIQVESGGDDNAEGDLHLENHAYGCLQIRQGVCDDVNTKFNTIYKSQDCLGNRAVSVDIWNKYWQVFTFLISDEDRAKAWNGGAYWQKIYKTPGHEEYSANIDEYWIKVQKYL